MVKWEQEQAPQGRCVSLQIITLSLQHSSLRHVPAQKNMSGRELCRAKRLRTPQMPVAQGFKTICEAKVKK